MSWCLPFFLNSSKIICALGMPSKWEHLNFSRAQECLVPVSRQIVAAIEEGGQLAVLGIASSTGPNTEKSSIFLLLKCSWKSRAPSSHAMTINVEDKFRGEKANQGSPVPSILFCQKRDPYARIQLPWSLPRPCKHFFGH